MKKITRFIAPALAAGMAMMAAAPAQANYYDDPRQIRQELRAFEVQIDRAANRGQLSERNATWLSYRLLGAQRQFRQFRRGGFNDWEMSTLNDTLDIMRWEIDRRSTRGNRRDYRQSRGHNGGGDYSRGRGSRDDRDYRRGRGSRDDRGYRSGRGSRDDRGSRRYRRDD